MFVSQECSSESTQGKLDMYTTWASIHCFPGATNGDHQPGWLQRDEARLPISHQQRWVVEFPAGTLSLQLEQCGLEREADMQSAT